MSFKSHKSSKEEFGQRSISEISESERKKIADNLIGKIGKPFAIIYEDITQEELNLLLEEILKNSDYYTLKDHSLNCLEISFECRKVIPRKVRDWISNILKASDVLILHLIQKILGEQLEVYGDKIKERVAYEHLENINELKIVGSGYNAIYDKRNILEHVQVFTSNSGEVAIRNTGNKEKMSTLKYCITELEKCLPIVMDKYRENHEEYCIN